MSAAPEAPIEQLILRHKDRVYRQLVRVCGNHDDAEDALADAIFAAIKSAGQLHNQDNFRGWLARIGQRFCVRHRVKHRLSELLSFDEMAEAGFEIPANEADSFSVLDRANTKARIQSAVSGLPETYRAVYIEREIEQRSAEEVAQRLSLTVAAVKSRLHRARALVRQALDECVECESS